MSAKVYVGGLSWNTTDEGLSQAFAEFGTVLDSIVMRDRETGRSRGFGFVTYSSGAEAEAAIAGLNDQELDGRRIRVNLANARPSGGGGGGGGYSGGGGGYSGGGGGYRGELLCRPDGQVLRRRLWAIPVQVEEVVTREEVAATTEEEATAAAINWAPLPFSQLRESNSPLTYAFLFLTPICVFCSYCPSSPSTTTCHDSSLARS